MAVIMLPTVHRMMDWFTGESRQKTQQELRFVIYPSADTIRQCFLELPSVGGDRGSVCVCAQPRGIQSP